MILSTWNLEYDLQLQSTKINSVSLCKTFNTFVHVFSIPNNLIKTNVESCSRFVRFISSMESLSKSVSHGRGYQAFNNCI